MTSYKCATHLFASIQIGADLCVIWQLIMDHIFLHCSHSTSIWYRLFDTFHVNMVLPLLIDLFIKESLVLPLSKRNILWCNGLWHIWLERNGRIFSDSSKSSASLWKNIKISASRWSSKSFQFCNYDETTLH